MLVCVACTCGSSDKLLRNALRKYGYQDFLNVPIHQGKDKAISALSVIPRFPEVDELEQYIKSHSKFAIIIGYRQDKCSWADIASPNPKSSIEAELIVKNFA